MQLATLDEDGWELDDGELSHLKYPETFWIPERSKRWTLQGGQLVKLMFRIGLRDTTGKETEEVERMWVIVERQVEPGLYVGVLDNDPYCTREMRSGIQVVFEPRHVIQISGDDA